MKIHDAGHIYELDSIDGGNSIMLRFVKREGANFPFNVGSHAGTNCQEVLRALIDRSEFLNRQKPCMETECAIGCLKAALAFFEMRAAKNHGRTLHFESTLGLLNSQVCNGCGHIGCTGQCNKSDK